MATATLTSLREQIDQLDKQIVALLDQRAAVARQVGETKKGATIYRPGREQQVIKQALAASNGDMPGNSLKVIYGEIIGACRNLQEPLHVAYLGPAGTYSEEAARKYCGAASRYVAAGSIDMAIHKVEQGEADTAVVPVENSTEGGVSQTLDRLLQTRLSICGEVLLPIHHQLLTSEKTFEDVHEVIAHPQALAQCRSWLDAHIPYAKRTAASSNAEAVRVAAAKPGRAAIASKRASHIYDLPVLARNIEDDPKNTTRFLVLGETPAAPTGADKTSLVFSTPNKPGALHKVLTVLAEQHINLVKLESRPSPNVLWDYLFIMDIDGHQEDAAVSRAIELLRNETVLIKLLGSYPKGQ